MEVFVIGGKLQINQPAFLISLFILSLPFIALNLGHTGFLALIPFVREEFQLTRTQVGFFSTSLFLSSSILAVFTGMIVDLIGPKKSLVFGIICFGLMILLFGFTHSYVTLLALVFIAGLGHSIIAPAVYKGVMLEAPLDKRAVSMGITQSGIGLGGLAGASLLPLLGQFFGWRSAIQFAGIFAIMTGFLVYKIFHECVGSTPQINFQKYRKENFIELSTNIRELLTNKQFLLTCCLGIVLGGLSFGVVFSHFTVFLSEDLLMNRAAAGLSLGIFQIGGLIGRPIWGCLSDKYLMRNRIITLFLLGISAGLLCLITGLFVNSINVDYKVIYLFSFIKGFIIFGWPGVYFVAVGEFSGVAKIGTATGLALFANRVGSLIAPPVFGLIADINGNYSISWILFGVLCIIVSFLYYFKRP